VTRSSSLRTRCGIVALTLLTMLALTRSSAEAAVIFVTTTSDEINGDGACSLQEAIYSANYDRNVAIGEVKATNSLTETTYTDVFVNTGCVPGNGDDRIILPAQSVLSMSHIVNETQNPFGPTATPLVTSNVTIEADGATLQWLGSENARAFAVASTGNLTIRFAYIKGFHAKGGDGGTGGGGGGLGAGGAIYVKGGGALTVENSTFEGNGAIGGNGGAEGYLPAFEGGLYFAPAGGGGGGLGGNGGPPGNSDCLIDDGNGGGGGGARGDGSNGGSCEFTPVGGYGGGTFEFNCGGRGGNFERNNLDIAADGEDGRCPGGGGGGGSQGGVSGGHGGRGNYGGGGGGGAEGENGGKGGFGGGGGAGWAGTLTSSAGGDGDFGGGGGAGPDGPVTSGDPGTGGMFGGKGGIASGGGGGGLGGAIFNDGGAVTVRNSTFTTNYAVRGVGGGGEALNGRDAGGTIFSLNGSTTVLDSTISGNEDTATGGGLVVVETTEAFVTLRNTIIANNKALECSIGTAAAVGSGNLITANDSCPGVVSSADPQLGSLQQTFPGKTPTMGISLTSPALNAADAATSLATDQRGVDRPEGTAFDIGAYERCPREGPVLEFCNNFQNTPPVDTFLLTTLAAPPIGGAVTPPSGQYPANSVQAVTATPNSGYRFVDWTGNVASPSNRSTFVTMDQPQTVTANFATCVTRLYGRAVPGNASAPPRVDLSWSAVAVDHYSVSRAPTSGGPYTQVGSSTTSAFSDATPGLINGKTFYYRLELIAASGSEVCTANELAVTVPTGKAR
jgi:CSLREA domain-containing protein